MKMKRSLILSLFAAALTALCATTAQATVNAQLNLFYQDPFSAQDPNVGGPTGGTWQLLVQTDAPNGIAGLRFVIDGVGDDRINGLNDGNVSFNAEVFDNTDSVFVFNFVNPLDPNDDSFEIVAGDDLDGALILGVGTGSGSPGNRAVDDLRSSFWDNSALIASGGFDGLTNVGGGFSGGGTPLRPILISLEANEFGADPNDIVEATIGVLSTRGDAEEQTGIEDPNTGLLQGDADRDGDVTIADFGILQVNFPLDPNDPVPGADPNDETPPLNGSRTWNQADFDSDDDVTIADFGLLQVNFPATPSSPPPISALSIPEPSTIAMLCVAGLAVVSRRRRTFRDPFYRRTAPPSWGGNTKQFWRGKNLPEIS